jgi:hypothetical protein
MSKSPKQDSGLHKPDGKFGKLDKKNKNKKDAQFVLRIDRETRDAFTEICNELDTSAAREVRRFMKKFIKRYRSGRMNEDI